MRNVINQLVDVHNRLIHLERETDNPREREAAARLGEEREAATTCLFPIIVFAFISLITPI